MAVRCLGPTIAIGTVHVTSASRETPPRESTLIDSIFEDARRMYLTPQTAAADIHAAIPQKIQVPASAQPTVHIGGFRYLTGALCSRQSRETVGSLGPCVQPCYSPSARTTSSAVSDPEQFCCPVMRFPSRTANPRHIPPWT